MTEKLKASSDSTEKLTRILIIDDDQKLCRLIKNYLEPLGYSVETAHTGKDGVRRAKSEPWDAIILDVMLPEINGFEVLKAIRQDNQVPVLMLTARGEEADRVVGLEMGADDYLPKTFSTRELLARLRAVIRRSSASKTETTEKPTEAEIVIGPLHINVGSRSVAMNDRPITLTAVEFDLLLTLARAKGRVKTRDNLLEEIRERDYEVFDRSIDVHISSLRKKLNDDPKEPRFIRTVHSVGYMFLDT